MPTDAAIDALAEDLNLPSVLGTGGLVETLGVDRLTSIVLHHLLPYGDASLAELTAGAQKLVRTR